MSRVGNITRRMPLFVCGAILAHVLVICVSSAPLFVRLGSKIELGSNAFAFRFLWVAEGSPSIDWNVLGSEFRVERTADLLFVQIPIPAVFMLFLGLSVYFWFTNRQHARNVPFK